MRSRRGQLWLCLLPAFYHRQAPRIGIDSYCALIVTTRVPSSTMPSTMCVLGDATLYCSTVNGVKCVIIIAPQSRFLGKILKLFTVAWNRTWVAHSGYTFPCGHSHALASNFHIKVVPSDLLDILDSIPFYSLFALIEPFALGAIHTSYKTSK